jgi:hypothetical protein
MTKVITNKSGNYLKYFVVNTVTGFCYGEFLSQQAAEDHAERINAGIALDVLLAN